VNAAVEQLANGNDSHGRLLFWRMSAPLAVEFSSTMADDPGARRTPAPLRNLRRDRWMWMPHGGGAARAVGTRSHPDEQGAVPVYPTIASSPTPVRAELSPDSARRSAALGSR
jgi:hypothetical protein